MDNLITSFLSQLGLNSEEVSLYLCLLRHPGVTILDLSKLTKVPRTNIYRLLPHLLALKLVRRDDNLISPEPVKNLGAVLVERELELSALRAQLPAILQALKGVK